MAIQNQNTNPGVVLNTLDDVVFVQSKVTQWALEQYQDPFDSGAFLTEWRPRPIITELKKYNLNDPIEYGAFILDEQVGFEEERLAEEYRFKEPTADQKRLINLLAITRVTQNVGDDGYTQLSAQDKTLIIDAGKPYAYANEKRLAIVSPQDGKSIIADIKRITLYQYNYDDACEKLDFDSKKYPGTNKQDPNSPCNPVQPGPTTTTTVTASIELLSSSFVDFDDYKKDFKSTFNEIGYVMSQDQPPVAFSPKQFQLVSSSRFVDDFVDVLTGPVRFVEQTIDGPRGTKITELVGYQRKGRRNLRTNAITSGSLEEVVFRKTLSQTAESIYVFKPLQAANISLTSMANNTTGMWRGNGYLNNFHTSSVQSNLEKSYKLNVVSGSCISNDVMFSIYYGDFSGGGTLKLSNDRKQYGYSKSIYSMFTSLTGNRLNGKRFLFTDNSVSQSQYLAGLLGVGASLTNTFGTAFITANNTPIQLNNNTAEYIIYSGSNFYFKPGLQSTAELEKITPLRTSEKIYAIQINPKILKNTLDEGNFELVLSELNGATIPMVNSGSNKVISLVDSSVSNGLLIDGDTKDSYRYNTSYIPSAEYDIVSGSLSNGVYNAVAPVVYGKLYPGYGLIVLDANKLNNELGFGIVSQSNSDGNNPLRLFKSISGSAAPTLTRTTTYPFALRQLEASMLEIVRIEIAENEFNYSTNPSYYYASSRSPFFRYNQTSFADGKLAPHSLKFRQWFYEPMTYITSIGLYDENYQLVAVGKLSRPVKKSFNESLKFIVKIKY